VRPTWRCRVSSRASPAAGGRGARFFAYRRLQANSRPSPRWPSSRIYLRPGSPGILFASAAENFRSTCGSERGAPACSKQGSPGATPHVGQGTENNCFAVRSLFLIWIRCDKTSRKSVPYSTPFATGIGVRFPLSAFRFPQPSIPSPSVPSTPPGRFRRELAAKL